MFLLNSSPRFSGHQAIIVELCAGCVEQASADLLLAAAECEARPGGAAVGWAAVLRWPRCADPG